MVLGASHQLVASDESAQSAPDFNGLVCRLYIKRTGQKDANKKADSTMTRTRGFYNPLVRISFLMVALSAGSAQHRNEGR